MKTVKTSTTGKYKTAMYPVFEIMEQYQLEQLGTKPKFWFLDGQQEEKKLCKIGRQGTGENWAEKVTFELAKLLGIPCATYDLAVFKGEQAVVSPSFVGKDGRLIHGNELLAKLLPSYDETQAFALRQYKLSTVIAFWQKHGLSFDLPAGYANSTGAQDALELFVAYLLFDAWIGNQDRHDQNWGLVLYTGNDITMEVAPSFDHASSLACRMSAEHRKKRLQTKDTGYSIKEFARKADTPFFNHEGNKRLKTVDCFQIAATISKRQSAMKRWLERLAAIEPTQIETILGNIPEEFGMNDLTAEFTLEYLEANRQFLLGSRL